MYIAKDQTTKRLLFALNLVINLHDQVQDKESMEEQLRQNALMKKRVKEKKDADEREKRKRLEDFVQARKGKFLTTKLIP